MALTTQAQRVRRGLGAVRIAALLLLASCATSFDMSGERITAPGPEWGVVIGSILVQSEAGSSAKGSTGRDAAGTSYEFDIVQIQPADPQGEDPYASRYRLQAKAGEERVFLSRLRPGQYLIRSFYEEGVVGLGGELDVVFDVAPGETRYIGRMSIEIPRRLSRGKSYRFTIDNVREPTLAQLSSRYADVTKAATNDPMHAREPAAP